jgi:hypothetical protein
MWIIPLPSVVVTRLAGKEGELLPELAAEVKRRESRASGWRQLLNENLSHLKSRRLYPGGRHPSTTASTGIRDGRPNEWLIFAAFSPRDFKHVRLPALERKNAPAPEVHARFHPIEGSVT